MQAVYGRRQKLKEAYGNQLKIAKNNFSFNGKLLFSNAEDMSLLNAIRDAASRQSIAPEETSTVDRTQGASDERSKMAVVEIPVTTHSNDKQKKKRKALKDITNVAKLENSPNVARSIETEIQIDDIGSFLTSTPVIKAKEEMQKQKKYLKAQKQKITSPIMVTKENMDDNFEVDSPPPLEDLSIDALQSPIESRIQEIFNHEAFISKFNSYIHENAGNEDAVAPDINVSVDHLDINQIEKELNDTIHSITISICKDPFQITFPTNIQVLPSQIGSHVCVKALPHSLPKTTIQDELTGRKKK